MSQLHVFNGTIWVPVTDEDHRADPDPHPGVVVLEGDSRLTDDRDPTAHAASHEDGGGDDLDVTTLAGFTGSSSTFLRSDGTHAVPASAGGAGSWVAEAPPTSPHAHDEEFVSSHGYTEVDPATFVAATLDSDLQLLKLQGTGNGGIRHALFYKAIPNSEFQFYTKVSSPPFGGASGMACGLFVSDDLVAAPSTSDFRDCVYTQNTTQTIVASRTWTAYNGTNSASDTRANYITGWLKMRVNGTSVSCDLSPDGKIWHNFSVRTVGFTPVHYGILIGVVDNTQIATGRFEFVRVASGAGSSGADAVLAGRFV